MAVSTGLGLLFPSITPFFIIGVLALFLGLLLVGVGIYLFSQGVPKAAAPLAIVGGFFCFIGAFFIWGTNAINEIANTPEGTAIIIGTILLMAVVIILFGWTHLGGKK